MEATLISGRSMHRAFRTVSLPEENCKDHHNADFGVRPTIKVAQHPPTREPTNYLRVEFKLAYSLLASNGQWGTSGPQGPVVFVTCDPRNAIYSTVLSGCRHKDTVFFCGKTFLWVL